jgi:maleamate amidohydrolase
VSTLSDALPTSGAADLRLPDALRGPLKEHIAYLRQRYLERGWGGPVGFGDKPALVVIDLALGWTASGGPMASNLDSVVLATRLVLDAARQAGIPIFFTTATSDPADPVSPSAGKMRLAPVGGVSTQDAGQLDPRLGRRPTEKIIRKPYASTFKGTPFHEMLTGLRVDTLIVTGCSTSHCVYATCRDAKDSFRVIVPREAVGERCELMHEVNMLDIEIDLADVLPVAEVVAKLASLSIPLVEP